MGAFTNAFGIGAGQGARVNPSIIDGEQFSKGKIILQFDDAFENVLTYGLPLFIETGVFPEIVANGAAIIADYVLRGQKVATWAQLRELHAAGCDIQCHGYYGVNVTTLTEQQITENYALNNSSFVANGLPSPLHTVYSSGDMSDHVLNVLDTYRLTGRRGEVGYNTRKINYYRLRGFVFSETTDINIIKTRMDIAKLNKTVVNMYGHMIGVNDVLSTSVDKVRAIINYAKEIGLDFISQAQLYQQMFYLNIRTSRDCADDQIDIICKNRLNIPTSIERSEDDGITWAEIHVLSVGESDYSDTGLPMNTKYLYRSRGLSGDRYLPYSAIVSEFTSLELTLTSTGDGTGVSKMTLAVEEAITLTLSANAKFYTDAAGTLNESSTLRTVIWAVGDQTIYIKCTTGTAILTIPKNKIFQWKYWVTGVNAPSIGGSLTGMTMDYVNITGVNSLTYDITRNIETTNLTLLDGSHSIGDISGYIYLTTLAIAGSTAIYGDFSKCIYLTYLMIQGVSTARVDIGVLTRATNISMLGNTVAYGSINPLVNCTYMYIAGQNIVTGDPSIVSSGLTRFRIIGGRITEYAGGGDWSAINANENITLSPSVGYGLSSAKVDLFLQEIAATKVSGRLINVTLKGSNAPRTSASNAAVAVLVGDGGAILTN